MTPAVYDFISLDLPALLSATLASVSCGLLGSLLVLRRQSLLGDAISHAVLPGLVAAFLIFGTRSPGPMFLGAAAAGVLTVAMIEFVRRVGRVDGGAAMGVVFSVMFALGVLLLEQAAARQVDLDADCVLNGMLESVFWLPPRTWDGFWAWSTFFGQAGGSGGGLPRQLLTLAGVCAASLLFVGVFYKELRLAAFDPQLATSIGFNSTLINGAHTLLVATAVVASFEAVGSILVIAMLVCPGATARLLTDRLRTHLWLSACLGAVSGVAGYALAASAPSWLGTEKALSAAGMITVVAGLMLAAALVLAPEHGAVARFVRQSRLSTRVAREDLLGLLYRMEESGVHAPAVTAERALSTLACSKLTARLALIRGVQRKEILRDAGQLRLSDQGRDAARRLVRSHRLWESYLVAEAGLRPDHAHFPATGLEHITSAGLRAALSEAPEVDPGVDPHRRPIPPEAPPTHSSGA